MESRSAPWGWASFVSVEQRRAIADDVRGPEFHPGRIPLGRAPLTADQQAEADRLHAALTAAATYLRDLAELLATKAGGDLLGPTEFQVRDLVYRLGAKALEAALAEREKGVRRLQPRLP